MSDQSAFETLHRPKPRSEYALYHAIIFGVALPLEGIGWTAQTLIRRRLPSEGPLARARRTADEITPVIFQA